MRIIGFLLLLITSTSAQRLKTNNVQIVNGHFQVKPAEVPLISPPTNITVCGKKVVIDMIYPSPFDKALLGQTIDKKEPAHISLVHLSTATPADEAAVLFHEIMHVVLTTDASDNFNSTHEFIYNLSPCLERTLFHDNPALTSYFIAAGYFEITPKEEEKPKPVPVVSFTDTSNITYTTISPDFTISVPRNLVIFAPNGEQCSWSYDKNAPEKYVFKGSTALPDEISCLHQWLDLTIRPTNKGNAHK